MTGGFDAPRPVRDGTDPASGKSHLVSSWRGVLSSRMFTMTKDETNVKDNDMNIDMVAEPKRLKFEGHSWLEWNPQSVCRSTV